MKVSGAAAPPRGFLLYTTSIAAAAPDDVEDFFLWLIKFSKLQLTESGKDKDQGDALSWTRAHDGR